MATSILLVDDEKTIHETLGWFLEEEGYKVWTAESGEKAVALLEEREFDVIITDILMPGISGMQVLDKASTLNPRASVMLLTAYGTVETAIEALRKGACDYILKPFVLEELKLRIQRLVQYQAALQENQLLQRALNHLTPAGTILGESPAIRTVREQIAKIARTPSNVLITGESGTGKELTAHAIHAASARRGRPFVPINCGAIPEALLESQLFGHVKGAFTSAVQSSPGLFVVADQGTLFLDEIGELPLSLQVKLLRVIEEREVWAVGRTKPVRVDVRIIASSNRDLLNEVESGRFREDLFYRLNVVHIALPPLRERRADIPALVDHFIHKLNAKLATKYLGVGREALRVLMSHHWKGNVRELENVLERAMILGEGNVISLQHLPKDLVAPGAGLSNIETLKDAAQRFERQHILEILALAQFDKKEAARLLGISLASLYRKLDGLPS
ncbi:MAG TPA: sigma-54 dependent transcriptional regulator [Methylomirabilota bacterium]|nr:sigma-54 dependent transcriptional regulator [Methylomirabilota bacterium]